MKKRFVIKKYREFKEIINLRQFKRNELFTVYYRKKELNETVRIGILVSKKNGNAVTRNKIKRQVREILDSYLDYDEKLDLIVTISRNYKTTEFENNKNNLGSLLNLIKGELNE